MKNLETPGKTGRVGRYATDYLNKLANLNTINTLPDNAILVTLDGTSLYTNIPNSEGIEACRFFLRKSSDKHIPTETLCDLMQIILNINNFTFNNKHYLQKHGAMGSRDSFTNYPYGYFFFLPLFLVNTPLNCNK